MINERARRQYLEAMGIQSYMPRLLLPAAGASPLVDLSFLPSELEAQPASLPVETPTDGTAPKAHSEVIGELLTTMGANPKAMAAPEQKAPAPTARVPEKPRKLHVSLWQLADLLILADRHPEQALPVNGLLSNILIALNRRADTRKPEVIRWPIEGLAANHAGSPADYFLPILQARRPADQATSLLCFGEQIGAALCGENDGVKTELDLPGGDTLAVICLPSLDELLLQPQKKAAVWAAIKSLRV